MVASVKFGGAHVAAAPDSRARLDIPVTRLNCCLAAFCLSVVALRPLDAALHGKLGVALSELSRFPEAEAAYRHALALDQNLIQARFNLAVALSAKEARLAVNVLLPDPPLRDATVMTIMVHGSPRLNRSCPLRKPRIDDVELSRQTLS